MKVFKDLKAGDTIYVGFEKKKIANITPDRSTLRIFINTVEEYCVPNYAVADYNYIVNRLISTDKEAIVKYYTDELVDLQTNFDIKKDYLKKMIEKANKLK